MTVKISKVAWGVTGSGDRLAETIEVMRKLEAQYDRRVEIQLFISRMGQKVLKYYRLSDVVRRSFKKVFVEVDANTPFLSGWLEMGKYEFLLIAPASSNTVAKIAVGVADSLLSNSAIMAMKGLTKVYVMPTDYKEGKTVTTLPSGEKLTLRVRREDVDNANKLRTMEDMSVVEQLEEIPKIFGRYFGK